MVVDQSGSNSLSLSHDTFLQFLKNHWKLKPYPQKPLSECDWRDPPDLIIHPIYTGYKDYLLWKKLKNLWGDLPFLLGINNEPGNLAKGIANHTLSYTPDHSNNSQLNTIWFQASSDLSSLIVPTPVEKTPHKEETLSSHSPAPSATFLSHSQSNSSPEFVEWLTSLRKRKKERFCNFIYGRRDFKWSGVRKRNELCKKINEYKQVDCAGRVMNNTDELAKLEERYSRDNKEISSTDLGLANSLRRKNKKTFWSLGGRQSIFKSNSSSKHNAPRKKVNEHIQYNYSSKGHQGIPNNTSCFRGPDLTKLEYMSRHKFSIIGENHVAPHYITEKIIFPLLVGSIPIYWGCLEAGEYINPKSFINCHGYNSFDEIVKRVIQINEDPKLYSKYRNAPVFLPDSLFYNLSLEKVSTKLSNVESIFKQHRKNKQGEFSELLQQKEKPIWTQNTGEPNIKNYIGYQIQKKKTRGSLWFA